MCQYWCGQSYLTRSILTKNIRKPGPQVSRCIRGIIVNMLVPFYGEDQPCGIQQAITQSSAPQFLLYFSVISALLLNIHR